MPETEVQIDAVFSELTQSEDFSWDAIWHSVGRITVEGYVVEIAVPLRQLRFPRSGGIQTWGFEAFRNYPRTHRHRITSKFTDRSKDCTSALELKPRRHLKLQLALLRQTLDVPGGELFKADLSQLRLVYQFNVRTFVRAIMQYTDIDKDPDLYVEPVEREAKDLFTQLLFSYKLNPQTVLFVGYTDSRLGIDDVSLTQTGRTFFLKLGYAFLY